MNHKTARIFSVALLVTAAVSMPAFAQRAGGSGSGQGGAATVPQGSGDQDRIQDRLRTPDQDRDRDQDRLRNPDQDQDRDRDRDQDRLKSPDQDRDRDRDRLYVTEVVDGQLSSSQLLTGEERQQFQQRVRNATSTEERNRIRSEYQALIRQRAMDLGVNAPFGPERAGDGARSGYYLVQLLTDQERLQFHARMRSAKTAEERLRIRTEMEATARERAREMGVDVPDWYGNGTSGRP